MGVVPPPILTVLAPYSDNLTHPLSSTLSKHEAGRKKVTQFDGFFFSVFLSFSGFSHLNLAPSLSFVAVDDDQRRRKSLPKLCSFLDEESNRAAKALK